MKYSIPVKFLAVALCAAMLLCAAASAVGLVTLANAGLERGQTLQQLHDEKIGYRSENYAYSAAVAWASGVYGEMPEELVRHKLNEASSNSVFQVTIRDEDGKELFSNFEGTSLKDYSYSFHQLMYEQFLQWGNIYSQDGDAEADDSSIDRTRIRVQGSYTRWSSYVYSYIDQSMELPVEITVHYLCDAPADANMWAAGTLVAENQNLLIAGVIGGLLLFALTAVYLCASAGHRPGREEIRAGGFNALPLDLYAAGAFGCVCVCIALLKELDSSIEFAIQPLKFLFLFFGTIGYGCCLLFVGWCFAFAAQAKMPEHHWWWNTITGRCLKLALRMLKAVWHTICRVAPAFQDFLCSTARFGLRICRDLWKVARGLLALMGTLWHKFWHRSLPWAGRQLERFFSTLPLTWQWLLGGAVSAFLLWVPQDVYISSPLLRMARFFLYFALVLYGAYCFATLLEAAKRMRSGELEAKVSDRYLVGSFREFAQELNELADVAMVAARKQLKSERMKTELITNVSHDIKTPLTSIINYVDLLEKPHTPEEEKAYLEVLSRQSQRMKKLIDDLMEMSKASSGSTAVEITCIDAVEAVNQALGEFTDKLSAAGLTPVFHHSESVLLMADGRLLWRAMSNILGNAVKYALHGTRLYVDVTTLGDNAMISFKNISGDQLNVNAEELMERFVRGDTSRNTEGSGLGLNIAKSLMELQGGQLQLLVDGDLFKVTLVFPKA